MNIEEIDKWLDREYGVSYTRLEELHDWLCDREIEKDKEIERLNNIINELEKYLIEHVEKNYSNDYDNVLDKLDELKGNDKE